MSSISLSRVFRDADRHVCAAFGILLLSFLPVPAAVAGGEAPNSRLIAGWVERVTVAATGAVVKAKLDTGAKTSSISASEIVEFERDGDDWVRFVLHADGNGAKRAGASPPVMLERKKVRGVRIKDHDDPSARRLVVMLEICFGGRQHAVQFSLADRRGFHYPVLLGRRFLKGVAIVDSARTFLGNPTCSTKQRPPKSGGR